MVNTNNDTNKKRLDVNGWKRTAEDKKKAGFLDFSWNPGYYWTSVDSSEI